MVYCVPVQHDRERDREGLNAGAHLEDVLQSLQRHRHDARVAADDEVAQRLDATLL